ncbi:MAG TPA: formyltetrahydrofolate deformylase [Nitrososphaeraceae archaeon]|nr:formyltetrahydrofolate deformylase [Nitrososphaeraceae archaeon]
MDIQRKKVKKDVDIDLHISPTSSSSSSKSDGDASPIHSPANSSNEKNSKPSSIFVHKTSPASHKLQRKKSNKKTIIEITVVGKDRKGVVAEITNFIFKNGANIEKINQNVVKGLFGMQMEASVNNIMQDKLNSGLQALAKELKMEIKVHYQEPNRPTNIAILVSNEDHCLLKILESYRKNELKAKIPIIIGSLGILESIGKKYNIPFVVIDHKDQTEAERAILQIFEDYNIDLVILARYMRILTPNFVWRYPNKIINIHPSLLPAFPGAFAYTQAYERGAKIVGCTAHFVTEDLDQGPIICQNSFKVLENDDIDSIKSKGRRLESSVLLQALKLSLEGKLEVYWRKVHIKKEGKR